MLCPRCGKEMVLDTHRKYPLNMCYECGYMEGRNFGTDEVDPDKHIVTNFQHTKTLNFNEFAAFLSEGLDIDLEKLREWLDDPFKAE